MDWRNPQGFVEWTILFGSISAFGGIVSFFVIRWFFGRLFRN